jgi:hypothetical protein
MITNVEKIYNNENNFCGYKATLSNSKVIRFIPLNEANTDYRAIQEWIAEGGVVIDNPPE